MLHFVGRYDDQLMACPVAQWALKSTLTNFNLKLCSHAVRAFKRCSRCLGAAVISLKGVLTIEIEMCNTKLWSVKMSLDLLGSIF
jgi:hypothetical protein